MKEKDGYTNAPEQQVILYVEKEDGNYGPMQTGSYITGNYLDDYKLKRGHLEESLRNKVINNEISPVSYYMILEDLTVSELASRAGIRKSIVKKHLDPAGFGQARVSTLKKYAGVFNIPVSALLQILMLRYNDHFESYTILEEKKLDKGIELTDTKNPYVTLVKIGDKLP
ncbi:MAG: hypothetical protein NTX61_12050 [Bacteroidetes bacterium]|nr:hypothetical protein [Bacteroidota bacterium]